MRVAWIVLGTTIVHGVDAGAAQRIVGVSAPNGGATLVKRIHVAASSEISAIEFVSNDLSATFPSVRLRRFVAGRIGDILYEARDVAPPAGDRHQMAVAVPRLYFADAEDVAVEIVLPPTAGVARIGEGVGVVADEWGGLAPTSYIGSVAGSDLQAIDADLGVSVSSEPNVAGEAGHPNTKPSSRASGAVTPSIELCTDATGALEIHVSCVPPDARVDVYDVKGGRVRGFDRMAAGPAPSVVRWDRRNSEGHRVASGVYFIAARAGTRDIARKAVVVR